MTKRNDERHNSNYVLDRWVWWKTAIGSEVDYRWSLRRKEGRRVGAYWLVGNKWMKNEYSWHQPSATQFPQPTSCCFCIHTVYLLSCRHPKKATITTAKCTFSRSERSRVYINQLLSSSTSTAILLVSQDGSWIQYNILLMCTSGPQFQCQHMIHSELP